MAPLAALQLVPLRVLLDSPLLVPQLKTILNIGNLGTQLILRSVLDMVVGNVTFTDRLTMINRRLSKSMKKVAI